MPLVGVVCTGDELVGSAARPLRHAQRNSNGPALCAALQSLGLTERIDYGTVDDDPVALRKLLSAALNCHILIVVGGVSVGKYDLVPAALKDLGCTELLHGVAMKPGKPTFFALGPDGQLVFGLPGNPLSALTTFYEFVAPAIRKMSGLAGPPAPSVSVRLDSDVSLDDKDRTRFLPAVLAFDPNAGSPLALPIATYSSADVVAGGLCDGVLVLPVDKMHYRSGDVVEFHPWGAIL
ncbi:hypothetical protein FJY63_01095 [Candidatus Sumerlaeota bacterium]|nr:hypothetical protein [Candidatus Sumerlaeota bacterium]